MTATNSASAPESTHHAVAAHAGFAGVADDTVHGVPNDAASGVGADAAGGAGQPVTRPPRVAARDPIGDSVLLGLSALVILMSFVMTTRAGSQVLIPGTNQPLPELCNFRRWTGRDCPGCGMTRAFISFAHGDFAAAWRFNPASWYFYPLVLSQIPFRAWQLWRYRQGLPPLLNSSWAFAPAILLMMTVVGQWLWRNLVELWATFA